MNYNLLTGRENKELVEFDNYLVHIDAISSLKKLKESAKKEIGANLQIVSSFRSFKSQQNIWNAKAQGLRTLLNSDGIEINFDALSQDELLNSILRWSAIPGASRHHWGTDFDIYDANKISKEKLQLVSSESDEGGPLYEFHLWLDHKLESSSDFFRPYNLDLGGVNIEKWHLSYSPLSMKYLEGYTIDLFEKNLQQSDILLKHQIIEKLDYFYKTFVINISFPK
jgi:LAS superfamily LD-carboxypeptidase LdcB